MKYVAVMTVLLFFAIFAHTIHAVTKPFEWDYITRRPDANTAPGSAVALHSVVDKKGRTSVTVVCNKWKEQMPWYIDLMVDGKPVNNDEFLRLFHQKRLRNYEVVQAEYRHPTGRLETKTYFNFIGQE